MFEILVGSAVLSLLHALLPNHWLPMISIGLNQKWSLRETLGVTIIAGLVHSFSTILIGFAVGYLGVQLSEDYAEIIHWTGPVILIVMGLFFIYRHHNHAHFHLEVDELKNKTKFKFILTIIVAMFFSPCLEISAFFFSAGSYGWSTVSLVAVLYLVCTTLGMTLWVWWMYPKVQKLDWHSLEHKAGLISGWTLIVTGIIALFLH